MNIEIFLRYLYSQMDMQACLPGSLPAEIKEDGTQDNT